MQFSRLHWIFLGLLGGLAIAYMWTGSTDIDGIRAASQTEFERDILRHDDTTGLPFVADIVVHPAEDSPTGRVNVVTYKRLARDKKNNVGLWLEKRLVAKIPYIPAIPGRVPVNPNLTIAQYLGEMNQEDGDVHYHYGWWYEPNKAMALGSIGGLVVIGGIWPTALGLISGAGFGPKNDTKRKAKIDWSSMLRRSNTGHAHANTGRTPIAAGAGVDEVARHYEQNLARVGGVKPDVSLDRADEPESIRILDGSPLEKLPEQVVEAEEVEVKGEYYPVVIRHTKKPE